MSAPGGSWDASLSAAYEHAQRATKAELARDYSSAFELYVRSGQLFLHLLSTHPVPAHDGTRDRLKQMANKVTARAEKIKSAHNVRRVERDVLSTDQQASILAASSKINARHFPAWSEHSSTVQAQPELSPVQIGKKAQYKRAGQVAGADAGWGRRLRGHEIVQDIVTDCSFVAALEAAAEHDFLFGTSLATSSLHPQDAFGLPSPSSTGRYRVKLHINGIARCIEIDDHLPYYPREGGERIMGASCRKGHSVWPALLEKAYLTLMGGYDFGGSNASIDAHALTAWVPEHLFLRHAGFQREKSWSRFHAAWTQGRCFATVGTPSKTQGGLVPSHNYAILDVRVSASQRYVTLMNPWRHAAHNHPSIAIDTKPEDDVVEAMQRLKVEDGATFTVTWDDLCTHFDSLFLNWDPSLFASTLSVHSSWRAPTPQGGGKVDQADPRFRLVMSPTPDAGGEGEEVWMLLTRHITSTHDRPNAEPAHEAEYIAVHVFEDDTSRGEPSSQPLGQARQVGAYVDGTHCLVRFKPAPSRNGDVAERSFTVVASRRTSRAVETRYTLSIYSHHAVSMSQVRTHLAFRESLSGAWTSRTAGGNATLPTFMSNPQYTLTIPGADEVQLSLTLECSDRRVPVQLLLAYPGTARGGRVTSLTQGDVVLSSGMYHHGLALCNTSNPGRKGLRPGIYTLIASTFEAATTADFTLNIESTHPVQLKPIPQEGAGMFHRRITASWTQSNAKGSRGNEGYGNNPSWRLVVPPPGMTALVARIKANPTQDSVRPYVNLALYDDKEVANSGAYTDLPCGAALDTLLKPGSYTLVASTYKPDVHAAFHIDLYTAVRCDVTPL
ncbi:cysteine proteinase [Moesziomyces antarcticus]|uniref:Related to calpain-like protease PalBory n=2 Tax=Pseudozyma antarctica TaxID=84753 RepID=A0A5C3FSG8_PSEA2|nr:cysteine proteinase [Moesziomyces antarcticus]GAK65394.1 cysteine proteinase [Moesziomyces antarcticus]SPO46401.1 related to calpain-like protease PalBory [Moesziomyces antarcticus]